MHQPQRTCVGCRGRAHKSELLRLVRVPGSTGNTSVAVDLKQSAPGRGAYLHRHRNCCEAAVRRRALGRALRAASPEADQVLEVVQPHLPVELQTSTVLA